jgi:hypothetical protein
MQTTRLKFLSMLLASSILVASCDDKEKETLAADDAAAVMNSVDEELATELANVQQAEGFKALESLSRLSGAGIVLPIGRAKDMRKNPTYFVRQGITALHTMITVPSQGKRALNEEPFDFNANKGVYTYNFNLGIFQKTANSTIIEIRFPTEGSTTNNAVFRLTAYQETLVNDISWSYYQPTLIEATLDVDGEKQASISAKVTYDDDGNETFADLTYFVNPYTYEMDLDDRSANASSFSQYLKKGDDVLLGWSIAATFDSQYPKDGDSPKSLTGKVQLSTVIFTIELTAPTELPQGDFDYNDYIKISITIDGKKAGNVVWIMEAGNDEPTPYVQYTDGSKEPLEDIFEALEDALNELEVLDDVSVLG